MVHMRPSRQFCTRRVEQAAHTRGCRCERHALKRTPILTAHAAARQVAGADDALDAARTEAAAARARAAAAEAARESADAARATAEAAMQEADQALQVATRPEA